MADAKGGEAEVADEVRLTTEKADSKKIPIIARLITDVVIALDFKVSAKQEIAKIDI